MTQRIGGIFSSLTNQDIAELIRITDNEEVEVEPGLDFSRMSNRGIYEIVELAEESVKEMLELATWLQRPSPEGFEREQVNPQSFIDYRTDLSILRRIKSKLRRKLGN